MGVLLVGIEFDTQDADPERILEGFRSNGFHAAIVTRAELARRALEKGMELGDDSGGVMANLYLEGKSGFVMINAAPGNKMCVELSGERDVMRAGLVICAASGGKVVKRIPFGRKIFLYDRKDAVQRHWGELKEFSTAVVLEGHCATVRIGSTTCVLSNGPCIARPGSPERLFICLDWRRSLLFWHDHQNAALLENRLRRDCVGEVTP